MTRRKTMSRTRSQIRAELELIRAMQVYFEVEFDLYPLALRYNHNHGPDGKFTTGGGTLHAPDLGGGIGGGNSIDIIAKSDIIESKGKKAIKDAFITGKSSENIVGAIIDNHKSLAEFTPKEMKSFLEANGYKTKPLGSRSSLKGIPFEQGGGYRVNFCDDGYFMYHPKTKSHHNNKPYWRASCGKKGDNRYDMEGNRIEN
jgi:hypothetical protein